MRKVEKTGSGGFLVCLRNTSEKEVLDKWRRHICSRQLELFLDNQNISGSPPAASSVNGALGKHAGYLCTLVLFGLHVKVNCVASCNADTFPRFSCGKEPSRWLRMLGHAVVFVLSVKSRYVMSKTFSCQRLYVL